MDNIKVRTKKRSKSNKNIGYFISKLKNSFVTNEITENEEFLRDLNKAHTEWKHAELYFQSVTEPDLIDYAIHKIEASRTKYIYLLKQAREKGIKAENVSNSL